MAGIDLLEVSAESTMTRSGDGLRYVCTGQK